MSYETDGQLDPPDDSYECTCEGGVCDDECDEDCYCPGHNEECSSCKYLPCACDALYEAWRDERY